MSGGGRNLRSLPMELLRLEVSNSHLTPAEQQVLKLLAMGHTQVTAAAKLGKSLETVRKVTKMARARLGAKTNAHAVAVALSLDLI